MAILNDRVVDWKERLIASLYLGATERNEQSMGWLDHAPSVEEYDRVACCPRYYLTYMQK